MFKDATAVLTSHNSKALCRSNIAHPIVWEHGVPQIPLKLSFLLPRLFLFQNVISILKRAVPSSVGQFVSRLTTFNTHLCWNFFNIRESKCSWALDTIQDIVCKLGIKPLMHLVKIIIFCSIYVTIVRLSKIIKVLLKGC